MWHPQEMHVECQNQPAYLKCSACSYGESTLHPRWILAFPNGDELHNGTRILVSPTYLKNFDNLLETLTKQLKPKFGAVRKIYSPNSGSSVRCLRELKPNHKYVVAGREKLRKMPLGYLTEEERELQNYKRKLKERQCKEVYSSTEPSESPRVTPRYWLEAEKRRKGTIVIFVHKNGDSFDRPLRLVLTEKDRKGHTWWGPTVQEIENRLKVHPIRTFYTRCGEEVHTPYGLKNGRAYVAVCRNEKFIPVPYRSYDGVPFACCLEKGSICHLVKSVPGYCESHYLKEQIFGATQKQCSTEAIKPSNINDVYVTEVEYTQNGNKSQSQTKESQNTDLTLPNNEVKNENDDNKQSRKKIGDKISFNKNRDKSDNATMPVKNELSHREVATQVPEGQQTMQELKPTNIKFRKTGENNAKCFPRCRQKHNHEKPVHREVKRVTTKRNHSPGMDEVAMLHKRRNEKEMKQAGDFKRRDRKKLNGRNKSKRCIGKRHRPLFKIGRKGNVFPACKQQSRPVSKQLVTREAVYRNGVQEEITTEVRQPYDVKQKKSRYMISVRWEKVEVEIDQMDDSNSSNESDMDSIFSDATFTMCSPDFTDVDYQSWKMTGKAIGKNTPRQGWICTAMDRARKKKLVRKENTKDQRNEDAYTTTMSPPHHGEIQQKPLVETAKYIDLKFPQRNSWLMQKNHWYAVRKDFTKANNQEATPYSMAENLTEEDLALEQEYLNEEFEDYTEDETAMQYLKGQIPD